MSKYRSIAADKSAARAADDEAALKCTAEGCPLRWSVDFGDKLCTCHAGTSPLAWPRITERINDIEAERAFRGQDPKPQQSVRHFTLAQKREVGQKLRQALRNRGGRDWAQRLQDRELEGERLTEAQRAMWRSALWPFGASAQESEAEPW